MARVIHGRPGAAHVQRVPESRPEPRSPGQHTAKVSSSWSVTARTMPPRRLPGGAGSSSAPVELDDGLSGRTYRRPG